MGILLVLYAWHPPWLQDSLCGLKMSNVKYSESICFFHAFSAFGQTHFSLLPNHNKEVKQFIEQFSLKSIIEKSARHNWDIAFSTLLDGSMMGILCLVINLFRKQLDQETRSVRVELIHISSVYSTLSEVRSTLMLAYNLSKATLKNLSFATWPFDLEASSVKPNGFYMCFRIMEWKKCLYPRRRCGNGLNSFSISILAIPCIVLVKCHYSEPHS